MSLWYWKAVPGSAVRAGCMSAVRVACWTGPVTTADISADGGLEYWPATGDGRRIAGTGSAAALDDAVGDTEPAGPGRLALDVALAGGVVLGCGPGISAASAGSGLA